MRNLVEIDRCKIISIGCSQYTRVPKALRRESRCTPGDEAVYFRAPSSTDTIIRIVKKEKDV